MKQKIIDFIIYFVIGVAVWLFAFIGIDPIGSAADNKDLFRYFSDTFIIPAIVMICIFILSVLSTKGMFDGVFFSFRYIGQTLLPFVGKPVTKDSYYEYKQAKEKDRKKPNYMCLLAGSVFLTVALVFYLLYKIN